MPKYRRRFRRRRMPKKAKMVKSIVKKEIHRNVENKYTLVGFGPGAIYQDTGGTGYFQLLNGLTQGSSVSNRIGNKCRARSLQIRFGLESNNGLLALAIKYRIVVFRWKTANAATPIASQLFTNLGGGNVNSQWASFNPNYVPGEMHILFERNGALNLHNGPALTLLTAGEKRSIYSPRINLRNVLVNYNNGNTGTAADITANSIWVYITTDQAAATGVQMITAYECLYEYEDA